MTIRLRKPYKVARHKTKQYERHYGFPAENALVVPIRSLGDQASCDVRWEDETGILHLQRNRVFAIENLSPIDEMLDHDLHEVWLHYYAERTPDTGQLVSQ